MPEYSPPSDIAELVDAVNRRDPDIAVIEAIAEIGSRGYLFVGTAESQAFHEPVPDQRYRDLDFGAEIYVEEPGVPVLQMMWSGKLTVLTAIFGDINIPNQRALMGAPLTPEPRLYGWYGIWPETVQKQYDLEFGDLGYDEYTIGVQADVELIHAVQKRGDTIVGKADILRQDESAYTLVGNREPGEQRDKTRPGIVLTRNTMQTVASLCIYGSDLWETGIVPTIPPLAPTPDKQH